MSDVVVLGDVNVDVIVSLTAPIEHASDSPVHISFVGGGSAANAACWLGHLGVATTFVGAVGTDPNADFVLAEFVRHSVTPVVHRGTRNTGTCIVLVEPEGERTMLPDAGANTELSIDTLPTDVISKAKALLVSAYTLFRDDTRDAALAAMKIARDNGATVFVDAASRAPLAAVGAQRFAKWTDGALVFANADEAALIDGENVIAKHGKDGASWHGVDVPAVPCTVVDTTGAGDSFAAGFIAGYLTNPEPLHCLTSATDAAAHAVGVRGARPVG